MEGYGCTEMAPVVSVNSAGVEQSDPPQIGNKLGSVGRPLPGVSVRLVNPETFEPVPQGEQGLLLVDGPSRMAGYLNDEARTRSVIQDGYYNTGDLAKLDDDGFLYIVDRLARLSKIGGEMVPHLKVEEALSDLLKSERCVVVGVPDDQRGERLAVLYTDQHLTNVQLYDHLSSNGLPPLWIPKRENFYRVDAIPTLGTGKTDCANRERSQWNS